MTDKVEPSVPISELQHIVDNVSALKDMRIKIESFRKEWEAAHAADRAWEAKEKALREFCEYLRAGTQYQTVKDYHIAFKIEAILNREQEKP